MKKIISLTVLLLSSLYLSHAQFADNLNQNFILYSGVSFVHNLEPTDGYAITSYGIQNRSGYDIGFKMYINGEKPSNIIEAKNGQAVTIDLNRPINESFNIVVTCMYRTMAYRVIYTQEKISR